MGGQSGEGMEGGAPAEGGEGQGGMGGASGGMGGGGMPMGGGMPGMLDQLKGARVELKLGTETVTGTIA
jgi:hypothetical protein